MELRLDRVSKTDTDGTWWFLLSWMDRTGDNAALHMYYYMGKSLSPLKGSTDLQRRRLFGRSGYLPRLGVGIKPGCN